jgi:hypothetical protein
MHIKARSRELREQAGYTAATCPCYQNLKPCKLGGDHIRISPQDVIRQWVDWRLLVGLRAATLAICIRNLLPWFKLPRGGVPLAILNGLIQPTGYNLPQANLNGSSGLPGVKGTVPEGTVPCFVKIACRITLR